MKKYLRKILAATLAVYSVMTMLSACGGSSTATPDNTAPDGNVVSGETVTWRLQSNYALDSLEGKMSKNLAEALDIATNGRLKLELYEPGALCQASDIVTYLSQGAFDCAMIFGSTYAGTLPEADLGTGIPFAWESSSEIYDAMENYGLLELIQEAYGEMNIKYYWNAHEPNYNTLTNFQVDSIEDYAGKKIRALGVWGDYYAAIGASPVAIPGTEVYQALQLGTIDGAHYGWSALSDSNNIREVAKYAICPSLCYCQMATIVSQSSLEALPADLRNVVDETIRLANIGVIGQDHVAGTEKSVADAVQGGYVELVELPDDVVAQLRKIAVTEVWTKLAAKSDRMAKGIEIIRQQSRDYGRQVDY